MIEFSNSYKDLGEQFSQDTEAKPFRKPKVICLNEDLLESLNLKDAEVVANKSQYFSGAKLFKGSKPIATAYSGHQFGHFNPTLGDGRAMYLGDVIAKDGTIRDIQLKGSGPTQYSRGGDGLSSIGPVIREFLLSEAMYHLGVPTTRALALLETGENVVRQDREPGGVITRVANTFLRVGSFEFFAARHQMDDLKILLDYSVERLYPEIKGSENVALEFLKNVIKNQATLVAQWMGLGFIHGVMNTDNFSISGETIDYGPCAFLDQYESHKVFSSIDRNGRYAFANQPKIAAWNLTRLADCLVPLVGEDAPSSAKLLEEALSGFQSLYTSAWHKLMANKLGVSSEEDINAELIEQWLTFLETNQLDYCQSYHNLKMHISGETKEWFKYPNFSKWYEKLTSSFSSRDDAVQLMSEVNPVIIPRNHMIQRAIENAFKGDYGLVTEAWERFRTPYDLKHIETNFFKAPESHEVVTQTFCGT